MAPQLPAVPLLVATPSLGRNWGEMLNRTWVALQAVSLIVGVVEDTREQMGERPHCDVAGLWVGGFSGGPCAHMTTATGPLPRRRTFFVTKVQHRGRHISKEGKSRATRNSEHGPPASGTSIDTVCVSHHAQLVRTVASRLVSPVAGCARGRAIRAGKLQVRLQCPPR